jgi:hypothetical protein
VAFVVRGSSDGARRGAIRAFLHQQGVSSSFDHRAKSKGSKRAAFAVLLTRIFPFMRRHEQVSKQRAEFAVG